MKSSCKPHFLKIDAQAVLTINRLNEFSALWGYATAEIYTRLKEDLPNQALEVSFKDSQEKTKATAYYYLKSRISRLGVTSGNIVTKLCGTEYHSHVQIPMRQNRCAL